MATEQELRSKVVSIAQAYIGCNEKDGSHKKIIDRYNTYKPLPRNYKVTYTDAWCATFVSAVAMEAGLSDIFPIECSCAKQIELLKKLSSWQESDAYVPKAGDLIYYDWQDSGVGDNVGAPDHVGLVEKVSGSTITVIEGNYSDSVKRRSISVNGRYIRGFGVPKYGSKASSSSSSTGGSSTASNTQSNSQSSVGSSLKVDYARSFDRALAGTYRVTTDLNLRYGAGTAKKILVVMPGNTKVQNYGYYTTIDGTKWLYVQTTVKGVGYIGFCSSKYLAKV